MRAYGVAHLFTLTDETKWIGKKLQICIAINLKFNSLVLYLRVTV